MNNKAYQELLREAKRREQKANRGKKVKVDKEKKTQEHNEAAAVDEEAEAEAEAEAEPEFTTKTTFIADGILSYFYCSWLFTLFGLFGFAVQYVLLDLYIMHF